VTDMQESHGGYKTDRFAVAPRGAKPIAQFSYRADNAHKTSSEFVGPAEPAGQMVADRTRFDENRQRGLRDYND